MPEALRAEKTRLAAALSVHTEASQALNLLAEGFDDILKNLKTRLNQGKSKLEPRKRYSKLSTSPKTGRKMLREHITQALKILGGRAQSTDVVKQVGPAGNFLAEEHTVKHFRDELWLPGKAWTRESYDLWAENRKLDMAERIKEQVKYVLAKHKPEPLDSALTKEVERIVDAAKTELG